ncbi:hypothetical protein WMF45_08465 [Sorangium sp. So ce448]|uniref:hypothetical protein n=1 Tax=Sorangium sp. So ce448 TaxID=3133314 RepID=UPI003F617D26
MACAFGCSPAGGASLVESVCEGMLAAPGANPGDQVAMMPSQIGLASAFFGYLTAKCGGDLVPATARAQAELDRWLAWQLAHLGPAMTAVAFERNSKRRARR